MNCLVRRHHYCNIDQASSFKFKHHVNLGWSTAAQNSRTATEHGRMVIMMYSHLQMKPFASSEQSKVASATEFSLGNGHWRSELGKTDSEIVPRTA
jgi:hypothetical protein